MAISSVTTCTFGESRRANHPFGLQAGEDLEEDEEDDLIEIEDEDLHASYVDDEGRLRPSAGPSAAPHLTVDTTAYRPRWATDDDKATEASPLLQSPNYSKISKARRKRRSSVGPHGNATVPQAVLMVRLVKGCVIPNLH